MIQVMAFPSKSNIKSYVMETSPSLVLMEYSIDLKRPKRDPKNPLI